MNKIIILLGAVLLGSCTAESDQFDCTGRFEAVETIISAQVSGELKEFNIEEGTILSVGDPIGYIDTVQVYLQKRRLEAEIESVLNQKPDVAKEIAILQEQLKQAKREDQRAIMLLKDEAVPQKYADDIRSQVLILERQITAKYSSLTTASSSLDNKTTSLVFEIKRLEDLLDKSVIKNKVGGTVLTKYCEQFELVKGGTPLYKIADLSTVKLKAYVTGDQLSDIKLGDRVAIYIDQDKDNYKEYQGEISWISEKAEFTPKTIQTKNERANLVYAVKIRVVNDGFIKIGMYGEVKF